MMKNQNKKIEVIANFLEELSWLFDQKKISSLKEMVEVLRSLDDKSSFNMRSEKTFYQKNNTHFLVGILPDLLQDSELFGSNNDMLDFAETVLTLKPSRAAKRSRTEYIGWIICEVSKMNNFELSNLVNSLSRIVGDDIKMKEMKDAKKRPNFSWNETIQKLTE